MTVLQSGPIAFGPVQLRLSEAITVLAVFTPAAVPGLCLGSVIANGFMVGQFGILAMLDVVFGSLGTLLGAVWTWRLRGRPLLALAGPVVTNALIVPAYLPAMLAGLGFYRIPVLGLDLSSNWPAMYAFGVASVGLGEALVVYALGWPLFAALNHLGLAHLLRDTR